VRSGRARIAASVAVVGLLSLALLTRPATTLAAPCPGETQPAFGFVRLPSVGAFGREIPFGVRRTSSSFAKTVPGSVALTMTEPGAAPFYSHVLTAREEAEAAEGEPEHFIVSLQSGDPPATIALNWTQEATDSYGLGTGTPCEAAALQTYAGDPGEPLGVHFEQEYGKQAEIQLVTKHGCNTAVPGRVTITIRSRGRQYREYEKNACDYHWFGPELPGLKQESATQAPPGQEEERDGLFVISTGRRTATRHYSLTVVHEGQILARKRMAVEVFATPTSLVYEGTDAFVNYCIDGTHKLYSHNLRLYCIRPGHVDRYVSFY
jgi:hypothetical protein